MDSSHGRWALQELAWSEVAEVVRRDPRLLMPVGALEQHGPHLPLGTNLYIASGVARALSDRLGILVAPAFPYGPTVSKNDFSGAAGLRRKTLHRAINELLGQWEDQGIEEFLIISAHRYEPHQEALLMALTGGATTSVYDLYQVEVRDLIEEDPETAHAGELETSLMLHLAPGLVHMDRARDFTPTGPTLRKYTRRRSPAPPVASGGILGTPTRASAEKGARIFERYVSATAAAIAPKAAASPTAPAPAPPHVSVDHKNR